MAEKPPWHDIAFDTYRLAWAEVEARAGQTNTPKIDIYLEELKEAMLDLKQATIDGDAARVFEHVSEILVFLTELRRQSGD